MPAQMLVNLNMARDRLLSTIGGIPINVVPRSRSQQLAASGMQLPQKLPAFHTRTSLNWCSSGTSSKTIIR
jgi:hypothetical protein